MVQIKPNANFYSLGGISVHGGRPLEYQEYRRCWLKYPSNFILREFPMHLDIEITSRCNLKCTFCDKLFLLTKDQLGDMDIKLYKKIIDEGVKYKLWAIKLSYRGEPLLHKDIAGMVAYAKNKGILDVYFNTNGMLLNKDMSEKLINAGLDRISISVEGTDPEAFESKRIGATFNIILKNIDTLLEMRKKKKVEYPKVRIQTIYFPGSNLEAYKDFWTTHCDEVAAVDYKDSLNRQTGLMQEWGCPQLWQRMTILWNGEVLPCNNDDLCLLSCGNAKEKTIFACWHDDNAEYARNLHRNGQSHKVKACDGCPWRTAQIKKLQLNQKS